MLVRSHQMSFPPNQQKFAKDDTDGMNRRTLYDPQRPVRAKLIPGSAKLFNTQEIEARSGSYDIVQPACGTGTKMLQMQNPSLLAFRNRAEKVRRPEVQSAHNFNKRSAAQNMSSLLNRKPLGKLHDETIPALETVKQQIHEEKASLAFKEDPIAYFSKRKDGRGHRFIYLVYAGVPGTFGFSPYELKKVTASEMGTDYFTMSATGVTHVNSDGDTEQLSLDQWSKESSSFMTIRKLHFFNQYFFWKPFRLWKKFVMHQRYTELHESIALHPFFKNRNFFLIGFQLYEMKYKADELLKMNLLAFHPTKKYRLVEFEEINRSNTEKLKNEYTDFITNAQKSILDLYEKISDPKLVQVIDSDFPEIRRRNPNLDQLMILEKKKAAARVQKTQDVNDEIRSIADFIRMIDYVFLENLTSSCIECWKTADENVSQELGAIFQVEVFFDDNGKVAFMPSLEELLNAISSSLKNSIKILNQLPRLLMLPNLRPHLRANGLSLQILFDQGPKFTSIISNSNILNVIETHVLETVTQSYEQAITNSQVYTEFYPIYKLGQTWNVHDYIITRKGEKYAGDISYTARCDTKDEFLLTHMDEPVIDFERVANDIKTFREDENRVSKLISATVRGALHINLRSLKSILIPIPTKALKELEELLSQLSQMKVCMITEALKYYGQRLKQEPQSLEQFVSYCEMLQRTIDVTPQITEEINFVRKLYDLFDEFGFPHDRVDPLGQLFDSFKVNKSQAQTIRENNQSIFIKSLKDLVRNTERRIDHFYEKATTVPVALKDADIEARLPAAEKLVTKVKKLEPKINEIVKYQQVIGVELNNFSAFADVSAAADFAVDLYSAISMWQYLSKQMTESPFSHIDIDKFKVDMNNLKDAVTNLQKNAKTNYPVLNELVTKVNEISPFIDELEHLSHGKMQIRHWNALFEECNQQNGYHSQITIDELLNLGILKMSEKIEQITSTSQGESELEAEFLSISNHWNKVQLPLVEQQIKSDETLLIGNTESLVSEIYETLATLQHMLSLPFVQGVRETVSSLYSTLENITQILEAWRIFQSNWIILSALFNLDEARTILPHQANRFATVQRKWISIARHTIKDTRLFSVCSFPALLEVLNENNKSMESILTALGKFLDSKRTAMPRLFFLSNNEVLDLTSATKFSIFSTTLTKLFMHVINLDCRDSVGQESDTPNGQNLSKLKIYGLIGEDGETFQFTKYISCGGPLEGWLNQLIDMMHNTVRDNVISSVSGCTAGFVDWAISIPTYIALTTLNVVFTNEVEECFSNYETNLKAFNSYEKAIGRRIEDILDAFSNNLSPKEIQKLSILSTRLFVMRDKVHVLSDKLANHSQQLEWNSTLKYRINPNTNAINIEYQDCTWDHGLEYWGSAPALIITDSIFAAHNALTSALAQNAMSLVNSSAGAGKQLLIRNFAFSFGRYLFVSRPFPDITEYFISKILIGAASSGSWALFTEIEQLGHTNLSYLFDNIRNLSVAQVAGNPRITISSKLADLNKSCRIFLTSKPLSEVDIPPQLRALVRPISLSPPNYSKIAEVRLSSYGFKEAKTLSSQISEFVIAVVNVFPKAINNYAILYHIVHIINEAFKIKHRLTMSVSEELSLAAAAYEHFYTNFTDGQLPSFRSLVHCFFKVADSPSDLRDKFKSTSNESIILKFKQVAEEEIKKMAVELPTQYIIEQALNLYYLLVRGNCVVIYGQSNSGKSTIVDLYNRVMANEDFQCVSTISQTVKMVKLFHCSDPSEKIFGTIINDLTLGQTWSYGQLQSALYHISKFEKTNQRIVYFDGPLTKGFVQFLSHFVGSPDQRRCYLNSMDSYVQKGLKVIVETDSLENATPSLLSKCSLLAMRNLQIDTSLPLVNPQCDLVHPTLPFGRAIEILKNIVNPNQLDIVRTQFCEIAPTVVKRVYHTNNLLCFSESNNRSRDGHILICDTFPTFAAVLILITIDATSLETTDEKEVRLCVVLCMFIVFSSILTPKEITQFDIWMRTTFQIDTPPDWVGYNVPDHFWDQYQRPALQSMRIFKGKLIPVEFDLLEEKPIIKRRSDNQMPIVQEDITIINAQMLPNIRTAMYYLKQKVNFIIHGPCDSGKTSFLNVLFNNFDDVIPVVIPASKYLSCSLLSQYISAHTNLISKLQIPLSQIRTFALIFENVEESHENLIEFIRMINTTHEIPIYSCGDNKIYEVQTIKNFMVIMTTRNYNKLPVRLTSKFAPIQMIPLTKSTSLYISNRIMQAYDYTNEDADTIVRLGSSILDQFDNKNSPTQLIKFIYPFCFAKAKEDHDVIVKHVISQSYYLTLHKIKQEDFEDKFGFLCRNTYTSDSDHNTINDFLDYKLICYPSFVLSKDLKNFTVTNLQPELDKLKQELLYCLNLFNTNSPEKIILKFPYHVLKQWTLVHTALSWPGHHALLIGKSGSGRYSLVRLIANMLECDFVSVQAPTPEEILSPEERIQTLFGLLRDIITNASIHQKRTVIFIRATNQTMVETNILINLAANKDFTYIFPKAALDDLYSRFTGLHVLTYEHRLTAQRQIRNIIRLNIHIAISKDDDNNLNIANYCAFDPIYFKVDEQIIYTKYASETILSIATKKVVGAFSATLPKMFYQLHQIAKSKVPYYHINQYYDFVEAFAHFAAADYQDIILMNDNIQAALDFLNKLESESHQIDKKLDSLAPTLQRLQIDSESLQSSYTTRKEAIETRRAKLDEEHHRKSDEVQKLKDDVSQLENELELQTPRIEQTRKIVGDLTDNDIETIRITAADPMPSLRLLLEIFCLILDLPPSYERGGQKLLMDPNFVQILISRISTKQMTPQILETIAPYFEMDALNPDELESIAPSLKSLFDWVECVCRVAIINEKLLTEKKTLEEKTRQLNEYVEEMNLEKASIEQVEASLENENKALEASQAAREQMEKEYKSVEARKKSIDSIFKGIDHFTEKWQQEASDYTAKKEKLLGDAIFFAFYLVFCGSMNEESRRKALEEVSEEIKNTGIETSFTDPFASIADKFISANTDEINTKTDVLFSFNAAIDSHHVRSSLRTPLLVDPDGLVLNFLISSNKPKRLVVVSQNTSNLEQIIANAICDGKTLILLDADYLHPLVAPLLALTLHTPASPNDPREIRVGNKIITYDPRFKLILSTSQQDPRKLPDYLVSRVCIINVDSSSLETANSFFKNTFIEFFDPDLMPKITNMQKTLLSQRVYVQKYERDTLDILADIVTTQQANNEYDYLADEETLTDLIRSKECYFTALNTSTDFNQLLSEIKLSVQPFRSHIRLCQTFWEVMSRVLPRVNPASRFVFSNYQKQIANVFVNDGLHAGTLTSEQHTALHSSLISATFQFIFQSLPVADSLFFMFYTSYLLKLKDEKLSEYDLSNVLTHFKEDYNAQCDFIKSTELNTGDAFEHLKYTNVTNIFYFFSRFIVEQFGPDYSTFIQHFQVDSIISNSATTPTILISDPKVDPTPLIHQFVQLRCRHENFDAISLSDDIELIRNTRKILMTALNRGNWVLVHYSQPSKASADMLVDVFTQMTSTSVNTNFRLIVVCNSIKYLSPSMVSKSKRVNVEVFPSIRNSMLTLFHHHNASIRSATNPRSMKKLSYATALLISMAGYRGFLDPLGFNDYIRPGDMIFKDYLETLRTIIDSHPNDIPLRNARNHLDEIIFSQICDPYDKRKLRSLFQSMFVQEIFDDGFSIIKGSEEAEKLVIPPDAPISNYTQIIQQIPLFADVDILMMNHENAAPIRSWNLSRLVMRPFLKCISSSSRADSGSISMKIENMLMLLPEKIGTGDEEKYKGILEAILLNEVELLNKVISFIRYRLDVISEELKQNIITEEAIAIGKEDVPESWRGINHNSFTAKTGKLASHLIEKHTILMKWLQDGLPTIIDLRLIDNVKGLFEGIVNRYSLEHDGSCDSYALEFNFHDPAVPIPEGTILFTNLSLMCGGIHENMLSLTEQERLPTFQTVPGLLCKIGRKMVNRTGRFYQCPLYKCAIVETLNAKWADRDIYEGESTNYVCDIVLPTDTDTREWIGYGTCLFCRLPDQFS